LPQGLQHHYAQSASRCRAGVVRAGKKSLDDTHTRVIRWAESAANREPEEAYPIPEACRFHDLERARETYALLDAFSDGMGAWRFLDVLGAPLVDLPEALVADLMTLRRFYGIADRRANAQRKERGKQ
jgi:hypothetical protein